MSLYNRLFGENEEAPILLGMLNLNKEYFSRFRDVELIKNGTIIRVFTRTGGGNREAYIENWEKIKKHELYIGDYDDDFDETYAYIEFKVPGKYLETTRKMFKGEPISLKDKFDKEIEDMKNPKSKAYKTAQKIVDEMQKTIEDDNNGNIKIIEL